jgi:hypothetical protein
MSSYGLEHSVISMKVVLVFLNAQLKYIVILIVHKDAIVYAQGMMQAIVCASVYAHLLIVSVSWNVLQAASV